MRCSTDKNIKLVRTEEELSFTFLDLTWHKSAIKVSDLLSQIKEKEKSGFVLKRLFSSDVSRSRIPFIAGHNEDIVMLKLDSDDGTILWEKRFHKNRDTPFAFIESADGRNFFILGVFSVHAVGEKTWILSVPK